MLQVTRRCGSTEEGCKGKEGQRDKKQREKINEQEPQTGKWGDEEEKKSDSEGKKLKQIILP